ncbi:putative methyltransferase domain-containing protein [Colletotrichum tabaci]|uniref:Methyltransferase domain-containing protein n=1 Tax=Colletotrichum tabaci TaxID=1209068 RepID=A0AAV9SU30_9PEZI
MHPTAYVSNASFLRVHKIEGPWEELKLPESFDVVHSRLLFDNRVNLLEQYKNSFTALQPGGILELEAIEWKIYSDDNTLPEESFLRK